MWEWKSFIQNVTPQSCKKVDGLIELSSLRGWLASNVQAGFCLNSQDTGCSRPTSSSGGLFAHFNIRSVCTLDLTGNLIHPQAWLIRKENALSVSFSPFLSLHLHRGLILNTLKWMEALVSWRLSVVLQWGDPLGLTGLWVATYLTQAVLHSWGLYIFHMLRWNCLQKEQLYCGDMLKEPKWNKDSKS